MEAHIFVVWKTLYTEAQGFVDFERAGSVERKYGTGTFARLVRPLAAECAL